MSAEQITFHTRSSSPLSGTVQVPGDKSISHRAIMLSALAQEKSTICGLLMGQDNLATITALKAMGVEITQIGPAQFEVQGVGLRGLHAAAHTLDLANSGTGMRLLAGLLSGQPFDAEIIGDASLMRRPMGRIVDPLLQMGASISMSEEGTAPLKIKGGQNLKAIDYHLPVASAQVKSCLLLAGLYAKGETRITEPAPTRDHTERMLESFGYTVQRNKLSVALQGDAVLKATDIDVPADISSAAFFMVAASVIPGSDIVLKAVGVNPTRIGIINILFEMGADISLENKRMMGAEPIADIHVRHARLKGISIPQEQVPLAIDELPVLMIAAACAEGETILKGAQELRVKESDRIAAIADGLRLLGVDVQTRADGMIVQGGELRGGEVNSFGDHRIAMAFVVAGAVARESIIIHDCANVETSFPNFLDLANQLGMNVKIGKIT